MCCQLKSLKTVEFLQLHEYYISYKNKEVEFISKSVENAENKDLQSPDVIKPNFSENT